VQTAENRRIGERQAATQPLFEGLLEQRRLVELAEHVGDGASGGGAADAERLDLAENARAAPLLQPHLCSRAGQGGAMVVDRPLTAQPRDRRVDVLALELSPGKTRADLRLGELAPSQPPESHDVGTIGVIGHAWGLYAAGGGCPRRVPARCRSA